VPWPKGFITWFPQRRSQELLSQVHGAILEEERSTRRDLARRLRGIEDKP
jgi:hypothetical protein